MEIVAFNHRFKFGQPIREEGPKSHQKKAGTPTMGGLIFFISVAATILITGPKLTDQKMIILSFFLSHADKILPPGAI